MPTKIHKLAEVVAELRQVDVLVSQGQTEAIRLVGVTEVTYYRWHKEFGGLKADQVKDLETENARLCKAVADLTIDKLIGHRGRCRRAVDRHLCDLRRGDGPGEPDRRHACSADKGRVQPCGGREGHCSRIRTDSRR